MLFRGVIGILLGAAVLAGRLALFLLLELLPQSLDLGDQRLLIGAERLDDVQQLLHRQLGLGRQSTCRSQKVVNLFEYLLKA